MNMSEILSFEEFVSKRNEARAVSQLLGYRITEHAEMYGSVICST